MAETRLCSGVDGKVPGGSPLRWYCGPQSVGLHRCALGPGQRITNAGRLPGSGQKCPVIDDLSSRGPHKRNALSDTGPRAQSVNTQGAFRREEGGSVPTAMQGWRAQTLKVFTPQGSGRFWTNHAEGVESTSPPWLSG
ncbi:hypothetical protein NDU88_005204 [Pleurodeles waltl]|uniref:Uncharacterized protein n=1 Tax=Pleurodeles waltl TaxID=8319 RepID=A0AAV7TAB4_PLEWA|nr:hypothetical protein NDU88_005204 [Pleurodeles waltl]